MAKEQLKPKKGVVVTEINGIKYFKLQSNYPGDYTKNCGLLGQEIDENFYFLRSNDIDNMSVNNGILTLTRVDGDTLTADISMPYTFKFDEKTGKLIITDGNGDVQVLEGFVVEGKDVRVASDATLNGDGTKGNPLRISELEKTGTYAPANEFLDMAVYDYFELVCELLDEGTKVYHYEKRNKNQVPEDADVIEYSEKPTKGLNFESPHWIKVRKDINLPDASNLGAGYRIVTRESKDNFGLLYNYDGVKKIQAALDATGSLWRVPTRKDWALMLNAAEYCEEDRNHDTKCVNEWTGKNAGARAKSTTLWRLSNKQEKGLPVAGEDSLPIAGTNKFTVYPLGYADGSRGAEDKDFDLEAFAKKSSFWSITPENCNGESCSSNIFTRIFAYDTRKVLQESSKPSSRMSIRLVKDFESGHMDANEIENILGYDMPVVLITNDETGYSKLWTSINVGFSEEQYGGVYSKEWSAATGSERGHEIIYYINEWDGKEWHKKQMSEGDSIVLLDGGKDESGNTIYNHEWRIYSGETGPMLIDTAEAIKGEFQKEIDAINDRIDEEISARTEAIEDLQEQINEEVDRATSSETALQEAIDNIKVKKLDEPAHDMLASYVLLVGGEPKGDRIDIPKDDVQAFHEIKLGHSGATIDSVTGVIIDGPYTDHEVLLISYLNSEDIYKLVEIDLEDIIIENEFKDGLEVEGHDVKVKIDKTSEEVVVEYDENGNVTEKVLSVSPDGVKVSHIQDAINAAVAEETERAEEAEQALDEKIEAETVRAQSVETALQADINAEIDRSKRIDENIAKDLIGVNGKYSGDTENGFAIDFYMAEYVETDESHPESTVMDHIPDYEEIMDNDYLENPSMQYINYGGFIYKLVPSTNYISNANNVYEALTALDVKVKETSDGIDNEIARATAAENSISGIVNTFSASTVSEIAKVNGKIDSSNTNLSELSAVTEAFSAKTVAEIARLDTKISDETTRAIAAENSISGAVDTFSAVTEAFSAKTVAEIARLDEKIGAETVRAKAIEKSLQDELDTTQNGTGLNDDGTYKGHDSQSEGMVYIATATSIDNATVLLDRGIQSEKTRAIAAEDSISGDVTTLSAETKAFSAKTVAEISRVDEKIEDEKTRAIAAENSISGAVDTFSAVTEAFSAATVTEIERINATATRNKVKSTGNTIVVTEATEGTNLETNIDNKTILSNNGELKTGLKVMPLAAGELESNVREAFRLVDNEGRPVDGTTIKIYKSSSLVSVELIKVDNTDYVRITYIDNEGTTKTMDLNIQQLIFEAEFKDGLVVNENGEVRVKIDPTSEVFLTVSSEGIKVSGLQNAINTAVAAEAARATAAEDSISANVTTLSSTTEAFSAGTVAKFELMESGWNVPGSIKHTIEDAFVKSVAVGSSEDSNKTLMRYYNDGDEHKYYVSSNASDMYYNSLPLSAVIKNIEDKNAQSSSAIDELSAATINEVARLDGRIDNETTRATAAENSISGTVNTLSAATESEIERIEGKLSDNERVTSEAINQLKDELDRTEEGAGLNEDGSYHKHNTVGDMANYITNANSLDESDTMLDSALKAESDRAIAAEESISGIVNTFSATTESTIRDLQEQLTEANSIIKTLKTEIQTLSGVVETIESQMAENIYSTVKAILQGASRQIKVAPDDTNKQITIGFSDDAIFGQ